LACSGECLVQGEKFQLLAHDKAQFSLAKNGKVWVLTVKSGTVEFSISEGAKLAFVTPKGKYEVTKAIPANGLVIGRVDVTAAGTEFATAAGVLSLASADGVQVIKPGTDADAAAQDTPANRAAYQRYIDAGGKLSYSDWLAAGGLSAGGGGISPWWFVAGGAAAAGAGFGIADALGTSSSKPSASPH
jgi:hypothetical protein